jgi:hypothetical protein
MYEDEDRKAVRARTRFHDVLKKLFCDYEKSARFLFGSTGEAVMEEYAWEPQQIERLYLRLQERAEEPAPFEQISAKQLGRLIGDFGPIDDFGPIGDFDAHQEVEKCVGLNLRERTSGDYEGEIKITKSGRRPDFCSDRTVSESPHDHSRFHDLCFNEGGHGR